MLRDEFRSGRDRPCPVCGRTHDADCVIKDLGNRVHCHTHQSESNVPGWKFVKPIDTGAGWGIWIRESTVKPDRPDVEPLVTYQYDDRQGNRLIQVCRQKGGKYEFYQQYWDGGKFLGRKNFSDHKVREMRTSVPIYRYLRVRQAIERGHGVAVVEGEKCVTALENIGITATTSIGGCQSLHSWGDYSKDLEGALFIAIFPDMDQKGMDYAKEWQKLYPQAFIVKPFPESSIWNDLPKDGGLDIADWILAGATSSDVKNLVGPYLQEKDEDSQTSEVERLKISVGEYALELDPFARTLLENKIQAKFKIGGRRLSRLAGRLNEAPSSDFCMTSEVCPFLFAEIEERARTKATPGKMSGFKELDQLTGGFQDGDLAILAARPSMGKTALSLNICHWIAKTYLCPVAIFSLEMSKEQLTYRLMSSDLTMPASWIRDGRLVGDQWNKLSASIGRLTELRLAIDDTPAVTSGIVADKLSRFQDRVGEIGFVMIDYLQLMTSESGENRNAELSAITRSLKATARKFSCPILCLSQLSRAVESRPKNDRRPIMSDLRDSGAIEQDADQILMLYRDEYYNPDTFDKGMAELSVKKNRNGPIGKIDLNFIPHAVKFLDYQ